MPDLHKTVYRQEFKISHVGQSACPLLIKLQSDESKT